MSSLANATNSNYFTYISSTINFKTVGNTLIFTTIAGFRFVPLTYTIITDSATAANSDSNVNIGFTAANYTDFASGISASGIVNNANINSISATILSAPASTGIYVRVAIADTGTALTGRVILNGFYT